MDMPRSSFNASCMEGSDCRDLCDPAPSFSSPYECWDSVEEMYDCGGAGAVMESRPPMDELTVEEGYEYGGRGHE